MTRLTQLIETALFRHRLLFIALFALATVAFGFLATRIRVDASFNKQIPLAHPYIQTFTKHQEQFGGANRILIALAPRQCDIFTAEFFNALKAATDEVFFLPGIDRAQVTSLFTPNARFIEVIEGGLAGGNIIPSGFSPTPENFAAVRANLYKSGKVGQLVAHDFSAALISAQLMEIDPTTGQRLDYLKIARLLEEKIRDRFTDANHTVHIIGFAKVMGDVSDGAHGVILFFLISLATTTLLVWFYTRHLALTALPILCSLVAVIWQLGGLRALGYGIDPLSILVPFLIFAIAVSHAVQMLRGFRGEYVATQDPITAARAAFRQLALPGGVALVTDTIGFLTMLIIPIETIRELALTASLGVGLIILTNLILLPLLLSYVRLSPAYQAHLAARKIRTDALWHRLCVIMRPRPSIIILVVATILGFTAWGISKNIRVGDTHHGVPELRQDSRYNTDSHLITDKFSIGVDVVSVIVETVPNGCVDHEVMSLIDRFEAQMRALPGVQTTLSVASAAKIINSGWNEGSPKWRVLPRETTALAQSVSPIETATGLLNADGSVLPVLIFLSDHKAETLTRVTDAVKKFRAANPSPKAQFQLASGNAGVMAATNEVVADAQFPILLWVYGAVIALCLLTFRSMRATIGIIAPLVLVSYLTYALMVALEIGLKRSTLPVVALGVGIGVDYGIYLFAKLREALARGDYFEDAMHDAFTQTGSAVVFTGLTLAIGVSTWIFSDLRFQADMGVLLAFTFLASMLGAIIVLPALARWMYHHHTRREER